MEIIIDRDALYPAVQAACHVVETAADAAPISKHLLLERKNERLSFLASGQEMELRQFVPCSFSASEKPSDWVSTVSAERLNSVCQSLPHGAEMRLVFSAEADTGSKAQPEEASQGDVLITSGSSRFKLLSMDAADFPKQVAPETKVSLTLDWADLHFLFSKAGPCMAAQDFRHYLNGLQLEIFPDRVRAVASDSHRLAVCERVLEESQAAIEGENPLRLILPRKAVEKLQKFAPKQGAVQIGASESYLSFSDEERHFICRLLEGKYPDYDSVLPVPDGQNLMLADRVELLSAITRAGSVLFAEKEHRSLRLSLAAGKLQMSASNRNQETSNVELPVDYQGDEMEVAFRDEYLKQLVDLVDTERTSLFFPSPEKGCLIRPEEGENPCRYLLMPLRI